jgi:hypothetical protein
MSEEPDTQELDQESENQDPEVTPGDPSPEDDGGDQPETEERPSSSKEVTNYKILIHKHNIGMKAVMANPKGCRAPPLFIYPLIQ